MPAKNVIKEYLEDGFYHLYNRGVEKRNVFIDRQDYIVFLHYLKRYLTQPPELPHEITPRFKADLFEKIKLISYCLMPNHFHLMMKQFEKYTIVSFMRALTNSYTRYFNNKYDRIGPLFQGAYRGVLIDNDSYLLHLSRYIHLNPLELFESNQVRPGTRSHLVEYPYSSYGEYLGKRGTEWVHPEEILSFFKTAQKTTLKDLLSYQSFVEDYKENPKEILGPLLIE